MSGSLNRAQLIGRLGQDPELRNMPNGNAVCNLSIATSETWKDKDSGEKKERTEWHRVTIYGRLGEVAAQYLVKGSQVFLEGRIHTRKWQDKEGTDRYTTEIIADNMTMLGSKPDGANKSEQRSQTQQPARGQSSNAPAASARPAPRDEFDDDIPF